MTSSQLQSPCATSHDPAIQPENEEEVRRNAPALFVISMTTSMLAYVRGRITEQDLLRSTCLLGCSKEHLINDRGLFPVEATWLNSSRAHNYGYGEKDHLVKPDAVDPEFHEKVRDYIRIIEMLDGGGTRVFWSSHWYRMLVNFHPAPACGIYYNHSWQTVGQLRRPYGPLGADPNRI